MDNRNQMGLGEMKSQCLTWEERAEDENDWSGKGVEENGGNFVPKATVLAKIEYCLPAWSGLCTAADRVRLDSFLRRCTKLRYISASNPPSVSCMLENAEDKLFHKIISNSQHVLQSYLTDRADVSYNLRSRKHNKTLIPKTVDLSDRDFLIRCLYKCSC